MSDNGVSSGMRWSGISVLGREASRIGFTIVLARLVGPEAFGIVAQAIVYIGIVGLLLDQGFSSALIQRPQIESDLPGVVVAINFAVGGTLTALTVAIAPAWSSFMDTPQLTLVLAALAPSLFIRAASITPRALLLRNMEFRKIGIADVASALIGGVLGVTAAVLGASYWALVVQIVSTDLVLVLVLVLVGAGNWPNLHLRLLREIVGFSWRAFAAGLLINSVSRNVDRLLVGKFQGPEALAFYGLAYRLLLLPVQLVCQTIGAVFFPAFSRSANDTSVVRTEMERATRALAMLAIPGMALVAATAPQLVLLLFGAEWEPATPIVQVMAMAGAMQAIYQPTTTPLILGLGHAALNLRLAWLTTVVTAIAVVAGLPFGPLGVAIGYSAATGLLLPVEWIIRKRLLGMSLPSQAAMLVPSMHVSAWVAASYLLVAIAVPGYDVAVLVLGVPIALAVGATVLRLIHRTQLAELVYIANRIVKRTQPAVDSPPTVLAPPSSETR